MCSSRRRERWHPSSLYLALLPTPRVALVVRDAPKPLPICDPALELALPVLVFPTPPDEEEAPNTPPRKLLPRVVRAVRAPRCPALTPPRVPRTPVPLAVVPPASLRRSASSAARRSSSRLRCSSAARRCASSCCATRSSSTASRSRVEPCQSLLRRRRWLCSVCDRMRVHVLRRVEAFVTVLETVWI